MEPVQRVVTTAAAQALIGRLQERHGAIAFYQSHGCCDGSTPMCHASGEVQTGKGDVLYATLPGGVPFWADRRQAEYLQGTQIILDVGQGSQGSFSLEETEGLHFKVDTRLWNDEESAWLAAHPLIPG